MVRRYERATTEPAGHRAQRGLLTEGYVDEGWRVWRDNLLRVQAAHSRSPPPSISRWALLIKCYGPRTSSCGAGGRLRGRVRLTVKI